LTPAASIIIPTYRRPASALAALNSVLAQQIDGAFEVLVADNACDPRLGEEVERAGRGAGVPVVHLPVPDLGLHNGRHAGAQRARGELLVFVDDDVAVAEGWLQAVLEAFADPQVHLVGGRYLPRYEHAPPPWLEDLWEQSPLGRTCSHLSLLDFGDEPRRIDPDYVWGLSFGIRKQTLYRLGGFHPDAFPWELRRYRGDGETHVSSSARRAGLAAIYQPGALVHHRVDAERLTPEYFARRAHLQGISDSFLALRAGAHRRRRDRLRAWLGRARRGLRIRARRWRELRPALRDLIRAGYEAGYRYHQEQVCRDPTLRSWVHRHDYWGARVPGQDPSR
jgi:glycosyltransferase involved in cell wall biosynthesis